MPRELTVEDAVRIAQHVVASYEGADEVARQFQAKYESSDELREQMARDLREMCGGESMYLASLKFLGRGET